MKFMDAIGIGLIIVMITMTILLYRGSFGPGAETRDFKIWEIPKPPSQAEKI